MVTLSPAMPLLVSNRPVEVFQCFFVVVVLGGRGILSGLRSSYPHGCVD